MQFWVFFGEERGVFASAAVGGKHPQLRALLISLLACCVDSCQKVNKEIALLFGA